LDENKDGGFSEKELLEIEKHIIDNQEILKNPVGHVL
jgi:hypothetical protein